MPRFAVVGAALIAVAAVAPDLGADIYRTGIGANGRAVVADTGAIEIEGKAAACGNCHGHPLDGGGEGGVVAPPLDWSILATANIRRPPYDAATFTRTLREGIGPGGQSLHRLMPRYSLTDAEIDALLAYLRQPHPMPGVAEHTVTVATILPARKDLREAGLRSANAIKRQIASGEDRYFGRQIRLIVLDGGGPPGDLTAQLDNTPPLLAIASVGLTGDGPVAEALAERGIVNFAPIAALSGDEAAGRVLTLRPGLRDQAIALARKMQENERCVRIVAAGDGVSSRVADDIGRLFPTTDQCPAALLLSASPLLEAALASAAGPPISHAYFSGEQLGPHVETLARSCRITVATSSTSGLDAQIDRNVQEAVMALRTALSRAGRDLSPARLRSALRQSIAPYETQFLEFGTQGRCSIPPR